MQDVEALGLGAQRLDDGLHRRHLALVVGAPDVDHAIEVAHEELVIMVGDVGGGVGRPAVGADQHAVALVAQLLRCAATSAPSRS